MTSVPAARVLAASAVGAILIACGGDAASPPPCTVSAVNVTPVTATILVGSTSPLTAAVTSSNCATTPTVTWQSSASTVASVSASGLVTALAQGNATISATTSGQTGSAVITVQGGPVLTVSSVRPAAAATDVAIDSVVRIVFSEPIDPITVTSTSVTLNQGTTVVATTRSVAGTTVTLTPTAKLTEFNTSYQVAVTAAVKSTGANYLATPFSATFATAFWDPGYFYRITNAFMGSTKALDIFSGVHECFFGTVGNFQGQDWYFVPTGAVPGTFYFRNLFLGDTTALEGGAPGSPCLMTKLAPNGGVSSGQAWRVTASGSTQFPGTYRLQNVDLGTAQSLDAPSIGGTNRPGMQPTGEFSGQLWSFTRLFHR